MELTVLSLIGGLVMLVLGLLDYALLRRLVYPRLRWRYERMKARGRQGVDPNVIMDVLKAVNLLLFPAAGLLFGDAVLSALM